MKKLSVAVAFMTLVAGFGLAQKPAPPIQPRLPVQPAQALPPMPPMERYDFDYSAFKDGRLDEEMRRAQEMVKRAQEEVERFRMLKEPTYNWTVPRKDFEYKFDMAFPKLAGDFALFAQKPSPAARSRDNEERSYRRGTNHLDKREYERAVEAFDEAIEAKGNRTDGALYWKAYALNKLGKRPEALTILGELQKNYSSSSWMNDAKALEAEIRQARGQAISPESETDEDLKIYAINSLINTDPERAVPLLDKLLKGQNPPRIKERALFVLAQSRSPKAMETIAGVARGGTNPDLQLKAVEYLGIHGGKEGRQVLSEVYGSTSDFGVKRAILQAYMVGGEREKLLAAAKSEQNPELRRDAIHRLGVTGAQTELWQLYQSETSPELKEALIHAMFVGGNTEKMIELAKTEKDAKLRRIAIQRLGTMRKSQTADALATIYGTESDQQIKKDVLHALFIQQSAKQLVDLGRKESDMGLKKEIVQRLSMMKSPEATEFLVELLNK